jgi:catalase-peroxidase
MAAARDIRETFKRMAMNDEETVALIAGGHTFGKTHGAHPADKVGPDPEAAPIEKQLIGWDGGYGTGKGSDAITSGLEGAWTNNPKQWDNGFFENLHGHEWKLTHSPAGANQWIPTDDSVRTTPDAHDPSTMHPPVMLTTDLALRTDPAYAAISKRFHDNPQEFADAFARAWYKLLHRDMGPVTRYLGPWVPAAQLWQDPLPAAEGPAINDADVASLKAKILGSGVSISQLVTTAWASAASFRGTDKRGGANGARIRLAPQKDWEANNPAQLSQVLTALQRVQSEFNAGGKKVSMADLIVLGGCAAVEQAAKNAGVTITVPFAPGRTDATQEQTDVESFAVLEPTADGFRNYLSSAEERSAETMLLEKAYMLNLTAPEMTVLVGGMRALGAVSNGAKHGVFTSRTDALTNDFFVNLLDMGTEWAAVGTAKDTYEGRDRASGQVKWTATAADLVFGSHSQLRALAELYAQDDSKEKFARDFVAAWDKVMNNDRFDLHK